MLVAGTFVQTVFSPIAGRLSDRVSARYVASAGMAVCVLGLLALVFLSESTPYWYIITALCVLGLGFAFFTTPITHSVMNSVHKSRVGTASAAVAAVRQAGMNMSLGIATMLIALLVGHQSIKSANQADLLTAIRLTFLIFTVLSVFGVAASLVGPRRDDQQPS